MSKIKILYAEDDATLAFLTEDNLMQNGYEIFHAKNGKIALEMFNNQIFDICILDVMMPEIDGFEVAKYIRKTNNQIPILFLSAKTLKEDKLTGLRLGADDYLVKPFSIEELILKIEIFVKRSKFQEEKIIKNEIIGTYNFDIQNFTLKNENEKIVLTQREAELLAFFIKNKNKVVKREEILQHIWGENDYFLGRSLDVFISRLRKIFANDKTLKIENLHGIGFKFTDN